MSKYHSRKCTVDGQNFDSVREARRWKELQLLERAGEIENVSRQVTFVLIPAQKDEDGKLLERPVTYRADFVYREKSSGDLIVEDTKGVRTKDYIIKRKLMLWVHGVRVQER